MNTSDSSAQPFLSSGSTPAHEPIRIGVPQWRSQLYEELHARPFPVVATPLRVSHMALLRDRHSAQGDAEYQHILDLCRRYSANPPSPTASCYFNDFGEFELRWERHTEFSTYTFLRKGNHAQPFEQHALSILPRDWLDGMPGEVVCALHCVLEAQPEGEAELEAMHHHFEGQRLIASRVQDGQATVWTAFRLHSDGFGRFMIRHRDLTPCDAGRLLQNLLEIETYRLMAQLALPQAREHMQSLDVLDAQLSAATEQIVEVMDKDGERELLTSLSQISAQVERVRSQSNYRLAASRAYYALVMRRLQELQETPYAGLQTLVSFMDRRLTPGMRTCEAISERLDRISERIDRCTDLIRTQVNITLEEQNQTLLQSMNRRSQLQLRLQQVVESISVVAISYYTVELLKMFFSSARVLGIHINKDLLTVISIPAIVVLVLVFSRLLRHRLSKH